MTKNKLETTIGAFEKRMDLRHRMLEATGVYLPDGDLDDALYAEDCKSVVDCYECSHAEVCEIWLKAKRTRQDPPDFCNTRSTIQRMRILIKCRQKAIGKPHSTRKTDVDLSSTHQS